MRKYRVKNEDDRILGPFDILQIKELNQKNQISETSLFQVFPIGDWEKSTDIPEIKKMFIESLRQENEEELPPAPDKKMVEKPTTQQSQNIDPDSTAFREFKFDRNKDEVVDYSQLKKDYAAKKEEEIQEELEQPGFEKTVVVNRKSLSQTIDKTVVVNKGQLEELLDDESDDDNEDGNDKKEELDKKEEPKVEEPKVDADEKTMIASIKDLQAPVVVQDTTDDDIAEIESKLRSFEVEGNVEKKRRSKKRPAKKVEEEPKKDNKKRNLSFALFLVVVLFFLLDEDEQKLTKIVRPVVEFPRVEAQLQVEKAKEKRKEGLKELLKGDYLSTIRASGAFKRSLELQFKNNRSLSYLIYTYSKMLPEIGGDVKASKTLYQLINIQRPKILSDSYMALGAANFYSYNNKHDTAIYVIENHLRLNKATPLLYALYLEELLQVGNYTQAEKIFNKLIKVKKKRYEVLKSLVAYYVANENLNAAIKLARDNYKANIKNERFLALYGNLLLGANDYKTLTKVTSYLFKNKGGGSPFVFAEALKFLGYIAVSKGKTDDVAKYFNESLKFYDSYELKRILATLDVGGTDLTQQVIVRSKVDVLIKKSKKAAKELDWEKAFQFAVQASDLDEDNLESQLYLASIQSKRGYLNSAVNTLQKLKNKFPLNIRVSFELIMSNLRAFKKSEARRLISLMSTNLKFKDSFEYLAIFGYYYKLVDNDKLAFERFKGALSKNPLRDDLYYEMAQIAYKNNKLKKCKQFLNDAQQLDPRNIDYKILYSKVLFEEDGLETAIGYLRSQLEQFKDDPKILGQMAVFYYRDQSYNEYKEYKERLERLTKKDESLYLFLVETSELERNIDELIKHAENLVLIAPGNLEVRIKLAQAYTDKKDYQKAISQLNEVEERLESYPRVNYFKAKIYILNRDYKKAETVAKKEIEINPDSEFGHYILGESYIKQGQYNLAKKSLEKSIQLRPDFYDCLLALGWLKFKQGYYPAARELYQRAVRKNPNDPEIHKRLGYVYKETGQSDIAVEEFKTYLNLDPVAPDQRKIKSLIRQLQ